jgi:amino acid adenylation domain-containing protein
MMSPKQPTIVEVEYDPFAQPELQRVAPTTEAQREIWLACQLGTEASLAYNESVSLRIEGTLHPEALQRTLRTLSNRHEALRATISDDGMSLLIAAEGQLVADIVHLSANSEADRQAAMARLRTAAVETPFDLANGPLFRATLAVLGKTSFELILTGHHIICDGWSFGILAPELMKIYAAIAAGKLSTLDPAESFAEYAAAEHGPEHATTAENDSQYWLSLFDKSVPVLQLPLDRPRPPRRTFASRREDLPLDAALVSAIRQYGGRQGASLFATMFAMFGGLMARLSGSSEVVVGVPAAGQSATGKEALVGHCVNLLPIRIASDHDTDLATLISESSSRVLDAYEHQSCTFGGILRKLHVERDPSRLPLVSILFNVDSAISRNDLSLAGLDVELRSNPRHFENFELFLNASQFDGQILLELQYNADLFDQVTVQRWLKLYKTALDRMVGNSGSQLTVASAFAPTQEDVALLTRFNDTKASYAKGARVESLIERQAATTPESIAVSIGAVRLTYRELEQRANGLAAQLRQRGVGPGQLVGLSCGRNEHMLVALLGILKSGAGYVPLDPSFPAERLEFMAADASLRFVVSDRSLTDAWKFGASERIDVDGIAASDICPAPLGNADDVAYVIYTSGSTGKPKGVRVPHRSVANLLESVRLEPGMDSRHSVLSITTLSFDIAVSEVILPLTVGARIVVANRAETTDGERLRDLIQSQGVNFIDATPSTWRLLLASGWQGSREVRAICTGEPLPPDLGRELVGLVGELWNGYGPTETTVWSSFHRVTAIDGPVPIGHPIANTQIHVLDEKLRQLPIGVVGELFIGGDGVTLGYLNRPDLTSERFIPDPQRGPGSLRYRTGDLGRWRLDGTLECLGRSDHQVKVRGYRIELGEIEANLTQHPAVATALVITREDQPGDVRIVAYVVPRSQVTADADILRDFLRQSLPDYMIPQHVIELAALPLLPNGKINRAALPPPEVRRSTGRIQRVAPRGPLEQLVLEIMERVLNLPGIGVEDDFFSLGGHSLLAARLVAQLNRNFDLNLPLATVFQSPTVARLVDAIEKAKASHAPRRAPLVATADQRLAPVTIMQERVRFVEDLLPGTVTYSVPSAHRLRGPIDVAKFGQALQMMADRQPTFRTVITTQPGGTVGGYAQSIQDMVTVDLPFVDLSGIPAAQRESTLMERMQAVIDTPIALDHAPLMHVVLYRLNDDEHVFLFVTHHLIWDGWSFDLLYNELAELYGALVENRPHKLEPLAITYADFSRWHSDWLKGEEFAQQLAFWKAHYQSLPADVLPRTDRPRAGHMSGTGATLWVRIPKNQTDRLRDVARQYDVTLNMLCMSAFAVVFATALDHKQVALGVPVRGRLESVLEPIMGFFTNLMPVHIDVVADMTFADTLGATKALLIRLFSHADVPFERLVQESEVAEHIRSGGLYQALFSFQDARERRREWGPLHHENVLVKQHAATQDLGLWLMEGPGGMEGGLMYNTDLYDESTVSVLHKAFLTALDLIERDPRQSLAKQLLSVEPRLAGWLAPVIAVEQTVASDSGMATGSRLEEQMAALWARLLGVDAAQIDSGDNFFDLGGSSLLAMRAVAEAGSTLALKIDPRRFVFESLRQLCTPQAPTSQPSTASAESIAGTENIRGFAAIWAKLLGIDATQISGADNFFDLGGSSLLAMRAIADAEKVLGLKIDPARMVYETLSQLCVPLLHATEPTERSTDDPSDRSGLLSRVFGRFGRHS